MAGWRRAIELALSEEDVIRLSAVARSRAEPASRVERARILLAYWENPSPAMNSRRRISDLPGWSGEPIAGRVARERATSRLAADSATEPGAICCGALVCT